MQQSDIKNLDNTAETSSAEKSNESSASLEFRNICRGFGDEWNREEVISDFSLAMNPGELTV